MLLEKFQNTAGDSAVFLCHPGKYEDVIQIYTDNSLHNQIMKDVVHHRLEGCRAVGKAEEHHQWFKESPVGSEGYLPLITAFDPNIVETPSDIQLGEVACTTEL